MTPKELIALLTSDSSAQLKMRYLPDFLGLRSLEDFFNFGGLMVENAESWSSREFGNFHFLESNIFRLKTNGLLDGFYSFQN